MPTTVIQGPSIATLNRLPIGSCSPQYLLASAALTIATGVDHRRGRVVEPVGRDTNGIFSAGKYSRVALRIPRIARLLLLEILALGKTRRLSSLKAAGIMLMAPISDTAGSSASPRSPAAMKRRRVSASP